MRGIRITRRRRLYDRGGRDQLDMIAAARQRALDIAEMNTSRKFSTRWRFRFSITHAPHALSRTRGTMESRPWIAVNSHKYLELRYWAD